MLEVGTKEENIIKNSFYFIEGEPEPDLHTSSGSGQNVPAPTGSGTLVVTKPFKKIKE